jgi:hypothetical protein
MARTRAIVPLLEEKQLMLRVLCLSMLLLVTGCAPAASDGAGRGTPIRLTDVGTVAGRWAGLSDLPGHRMDDQYVEVTVRDDGTYEATSARTIGVMDARGRVQLSDGRLLIEGSDGARGTATLYSADGQRTLLVEMVTARAGNVTARLRPKP